MYNIFKYKKYEKIKTENGWTVKSVLWKKNSNGEIAFKEELNSDKFPYIGITYSDESFKDIVRTSKLVYNKDKSWTQYETYEQLQDDYQSIIGTFDNKKRKLSTKMYSDKNFENLIRESTRKYNKNDSYEERIIDYISEFNAINYYNKKDIKYKRNLYDKDFKNLIDTSEIKKLKNGNVIYKTICINKDCRNYYFITTYNSEFDLKILSQKEYKDSKFKKLAGTFQYTYNNDGSYERKWLNKGHNDNNYYVESEYYIEKFSNKKELIEQFVKYNWCQGYCKTKWKYEKGIYKEIERHVTYDEKEFNTFLTKYEYDDKNRTIKTLEYNNDFENPVQICTYEYQKNGDYIIYRINKNTEKKHFKEYFNLDNHCTKREYYNDEELKNLNRIETYKTLENGNHIIKSQYFEDGEISSSIKLVENNWINLKEETCYKDSNFKEFKSKTEWVYGKTPSNFIIKKIYAEPYKNMLSSIEINNKRKSHGIGFSDANFKIKCQEAWEKYNKNDEKIKLKTYEKPQEGYKAILSKYDKDGNEIYEKKYKFKGILARILYFFAK